MKVIVFTGPESTGKSWLSGYMAGYYHTTWLPEYLRTYYNQYHGIRKEDMREVAKRQIRHENEILKHNYDLVFFDTNILNLKIYHQYYYHEEASWFDEFYDAGIYTHYILLNTDIPWTADVQRDSPKARENLFPLFLNELERMQAPFTLVGGNYEQRLQKSKEVIQQIIS